MVFIFHCPESSNIFETDDFYLADNHGIGIDIHGKKVLLATVVLNVPCPYCQKIHRYRAEDLACPFAPQ